MDIKRGQQIKWKTANGVRSGVVIDEWDGYYLVKVESDKYVIVNEKSIVI